MSDRLVTVEQYQFLPEAEAVRMHLESEGISAHLADAEMVSLDWALGNAMGYIKLQVPQSDAAKAQSVLGELRSKRLERDQAPESDELGRCLSCDTSLPPNQSKCPKCGWSYADGEDPTNEFADGHQETTEAGDSADEGVMENLRSIKRPIMMMVLMPILVAIAFFAIMMLGWIMELITGNSYN